MGIKKKIILNFIILLLFAEFSSHAQIIAVTGKVTDSINKPLSYANILAIPESDNEEVRFAITKENGNYKHGLSKKQTYEITVSYLGLVNNIFNKKYISNGYYFTFDDDFSNPGIITTVEGAGYYPQATTNFLMGVTLKF